MIFEFLFLAKPEENAKIELRTDKSSNQVKNIAAWPRGSKRFFTPGGNS
jgi:hypothetical protein